MLQNYLKIALRSLLKQKVYTAINILGLATGIASCILIMLYVSNELSYDNFHEKGDRIYKLALERIYPNHRTFYSIIPHSYGDAIRNDFAEVQSVVKMGGPFNNNLISYRNSRDEVKQFEENWIMAADSNFFDVFSIKVLKGDAQKALAKASDIVITESTAKRYFGEEDPIGKTLSMFNQQFQVTAVCEDVPENSHMKFDFLGKWVDEFFGGGVINYTSFSAHIYVELKAGADAKALEAKFPKMVDTYAAAQIENNLGKSWADYKKEGNGYRYFLQAIKDIHLDPTNLEAKMQPGGNANYVYFLLCVAVLILAIACINFMNLATARSAERAKEVGVRKTMGSLKGQLVNQFLTESMLISLVGSIVAVVIILLILPSFNTAIGKQLTFETTPWLVAGLIAITLLVGLLAGSYPAFVLSSYNPVSILKGKFVANAKGSVLRNGLVVFQFFISIVLIVGTLVVGQQMDFMQRKSLGYNKDHVVVIERLFALNQQAETFIDELKRMSGVEDAAGAGSMLGGGRLDTFGEQWTAEGSTEILTTKTMVINDDFSKAIGFDILEGKAFSNETNDSLSLMLNETAVKTFGLTNPVGQKLQQKQNTPNGTITVQYTITGVVKDFNFQTLHDPITPLTIRNNESFGGGIGYAYVRIKEPNFNEVIQQMENKWKELAPGQPFKYVFLDENLKSQYKAEQQVGLIFTVFSGLAIVIACVGLFGLAAYTANLRTKEIGVRKVLGATVSSVVLLLSKDFTKLIVIAFVLAVPAGWLIMKKWLDGFAFHIDLKPGVFATAGFIALSIALITVSYHSIKAAVVNPIKSLRSE